jgi:hypothetical protein
MSAALSTSLLSRCADAVARAAAYIRTRQSPSGGFCFYRYGGIDEPNLGDTYYAVAALRLFNIEVPNARKTMEFVAEARIFGLTYLYFCCFSLEHLGFASRVAEEALELIRSLPITVPQPASSVDPSGWLETVRKTIRLQQRFTPMTAGRPGRPYEQVAGFVVDLMMREGFGVRSNLWDTRVALSVGALLGLRPPEDMAAFVDSLQQPPVGFLMTPRSAVASLDVAYAGARSCEILGIAVRYRQEVIDFTLSCQTDNGGFAHAPMALPNIEFTYRGLRTLAILVPELKRRSLHDFEHSRG